jgi:demethylmenaquinone methyltransferase/2-methoxy-6-polyprenyl-1,4-benzoquinol methylase
MNPPETPILYPDSKIEIRGFLARHYDLLLDVFTLGWYRSFIRKAIGWMKIQPSDRIVDLGAGTGRNALWMLPYLGDNGKILGLDVGRDMAIQFKKRCRAFPRISFLRQRIDLPFQIDETFDKALLSFVFHGFPGEVRETILKNCHNLLVPKGELILIDYNEFSLEALPWYLRLPFRMAECPYAFEFIQQPIEPLLARHGFAVEETRLFVRGMLRCLRARRDVD